MLDLLWLKSGTEFGDVSGPIMVSRIGDAGWTDRRVKVPE